MKEYNMNQCKLQKGKSITTSWIPSKYAVKDKFVKLKKVNGWKVLEVFRPSKPSSSVVERSDDYKHTRKASDI